MCIRNSCYFATFLHHSRRRNFIIFPVKNTYKRLKNNWTKRSKWIERSLKRSTTLLYFVDFINGIQLQRYHFGLYFWKHCVHFRWNNRICVLLQVDLDLFLKILQLLCVSDRNRLEQNRPLRVHAPLKRVRQRRVSFLIYTYTYLYLCFFLVITFRLNNKETFALFSFMVTTLIVLTSDDYCSISESTNLLKCYYFVWVSARKQRIIFQDKIKPNARAAYFRVLRFFMPTINVMTFYLIQNH